MNGQVNESLVESGSMDVLEILVKAAGVDFDPTRAAQVIRAAAREIPPTQSRAARSRMIRAASVLGVQLTSRQLSVREALSVVSDETPLALFTVTPSGIARWFTLVEAKSGDGRLANFDAGDGEGWLNAKDLARQLGATDTDSVLEWFVAQPAAPLAWARAGSDEAGAPASISLSSHHHDHHAHHLPPFRRLLGLLRPETRDLMIVLLFAVGVGLFTLATPIVAMAVVNTAALGTLLQQLLVLCLALFVALAFAGVLHFLQTLVVEYIQRRLFIRVAADLAYRLPRVDLRAFDRQHGPELVNRFFDVLTVQKAAATLLMDGITIALQILIGLLLLGYYHLYLLGFDLVLILSLALLFFGLGWGAVKTAVRESVAKFAVASWMEEVARHPVAFKFSGGPQLAREKTDLLTRDYLLARSAHFRVLMRQFGFALFLQAATNVGLLAIGGFLVVEGRLTLGELVAAEIVVTMVVATFTKLGKQLEAYYDLLAAVDKLGYLVDLPLERTGGAPHQTRSRGASVTVHDLGFAYEGFHHNVLSELSLRIEPGEKVALVGPNGAGKSTLVDMMFGLRTPNRGWVEIDGVDLRDIRLDTLREHIALVKGIEIFEESILANVQMGREEVNLHDVREALHKVGLLQTVMGYPLGLSTMLGTGGSPLSLGQANRLMIARAIAGQPRLLILDESLDHMDTEIREKVLPAILGKDAMWTLLVVTHSEEVMQLCDRVVRIERNQALVSAHTNGVAHG